MSAHRVPFEDRLWSSIVVVENCWEWVGSTTPDGYGKTYINSKTKRAHRQAYELLRGPIPAGMVVDHLCRNRRCVNPDHMELVAPGENTVRGYGPPAMNRRKTHCVRGHLLAGDNLYNSKSGWRDCKRCNHERKQILGASKEGGE